MNKRYWILSGIVLLGLSLLIAIMGLLSYTRRPVIWVVSSESSQYLPQTGAVIRLSANHPLDRRSVESALTFEPELEFRVSWSVDTMQIKFAENLNSNSVYKLTISTAAQDIYGQALAAPYIFEFRSSPAGFAYLEPNAREGTADRIVLVSDVQENKTKALFEQSKIVEFDINDQHLAVIYEDSNMESHLYIAALGEASAGWLVESGIQDLHLSKLSLSPLEDQLAFLGQRVELVQNVPVPQNQNRVYLYDISRRYLREVGPAGVIDLGYTPDGSAIWLRGNGPDHYLLDLSQPEAELVELGDHFGMGGFSQNREKVVFVDFEPYTDDASYPYINVMDKDRSLNAITSGDNFVVDPQFFFDSSNIIFSARSSELEGTRGLFSILVVNESAQIIHTISYPGYSLELPRVSWDDRYILIERYDSEMLRDYNGMRDFIFQTKPYKAELMIYDMLNESFLSYTYSGRDAVWLR